MKSERLLSYMSDPVKAKLILEINKQQQATAKQLAEICSGIPQATLYRHLKRMLSDGILKVVSENRIRGTVEKVYAIGIDPGDDIEKMLRENDGEMYFQIITQQLLGILQEFQEYSTRAAIDILHDGSGILVTPVYATTEELTQAIIKINEVMASLYQNPADGERSLHNICIVTTPPKV